MVTQLLILDINVWISRLAESIQLDMSHSTRLFFPFQKVQHSTSAFSTPIQMPWLTIPLARPSSPSDPPPQSFPRYDSSSSSDLRIPSTAANITDTTVSPVPLPADPTPAPSFQSVAPVQSHTHNPVRTHPMVLRPALKKRNLEGNLVSVAVSDSVPPVILREPSNYSQAFKHKVWCDAMQSEIDALHKNHTWTLVPAPTNANIIGNKWVHKIK